MDVFNYYADKLTEQDKKIFLDIYEAGSISIFSLMEKYTAQNSKDPESLSELITATRTLKKECRELVLTPTENLKAYGFITISNSNNNKLRMCVLTEAGLLIAEKIAKIKKSY